MRQTRWQPLPLWNQLQQFQNELNHLFNRWQDGNGGTATGNYPPVNIIEDGDTILVDAELPGLNLNDLEIYVTGTNQLTLKGERKPVTQEKSVCHRQERGFGTFVRVLTLPFPVDAQKVDARLEQGVLQIQLAKHESARPRKITVKGE